MTFKKSQKKPDDVAYTAKQLAPVERRDIESKLVIYGDVTPAVQIDVKAEVGGRIRTIHVEAGDVVNKGDLLLEVDDTELQNEKKAALTEVEGARIASEKTRRNYERARQLYDEKLISLEIFDNLKADLDIGLNNLTRSERRLEIVEERLSKTRILSPASGTILALSVQEGQVVIPAASVNSGTSLMLVADLENLLVDSHVNQVDVAKIRKDQNVTLTSDALRNVKMPARIAFIAPVASTKNNVKGFRIEVAIEEAPQEIRPGMTVAVNVPLGEAKDAISVPVGAVFSDEKEGSIVYVLNGGRTPEKRKVSVGLTNLFFAEIIEGLSPGEEILLVAPEPEIKPS